MISNFFLGIGQIFNFGVYAKQLAGQQFGWAWILVILVLLLMLAIWGALIFLLVLAIRKYIRFRRSMVGKEDLLEEIAELHRDVIRLTAEKEKIMSLKVSSAGVSIDELQAALGINQQNSFEELPEGRGSGVLVFSGFDKYWHFCKV